MLDCRFGGREVLPAWVSADEDCGGPRSRDRREDGGEWELFERATAMGAEEVLVLRVFGGEVGKACREEREEKMAGIGQGGAEVDGAFGHVE